MGTVGAKSSWGPEGRPLRSLRVADLRDWLSSLRASRGAGAEGSLAVEQPAAAGGADVPVGQEVTEPQAVFQSEGISRQDVLEELGQLLERVSAQGAAISPQELLHVQQLVGMLNVQAKVGVQTSQQTTQGLEGLLRQSG